MRTKSYNVALLLFDEVELQSFAGLLQVLSSAGRQWNFRPFKVFTVAEQPGSIATREQVSVTAEQALHACPTPEILLVPGGYGARRAAESKAVRDYVAAAVPGALLVGAVGLGVTVLAAAGCLKTHQVAASPETLTALSAVGPDFVTHDVRVHASGTLFTAARSADSLELGLLVVSKLLGKKPADAVAGMLGCTWAIEQLTLDLIGLDVTDVGKR